MAHATSVYSRWVGSNESRYQRPEHRTRNTSHQIRREPHVRDLVVLLRPYTSHAATSRSPMSGACRRTALDRLSHPVSCTTTNVDTNTHHFIVSGRFGPPTALDAFGSRIGRLMSTTTGYQADPYCFESDVPFSMPMTNDAVRETTWAYLARRARSPRNRITAPVGR